MLPRYQVIKDFISQAIRERVYAADDRIPAENELAKKFGVSRMTANRAIKELVAAGMLVRHQGLGTFVSNIQAESPLLRVRNIADEIRDRHHVYSNELYRLDEIQADEALAGRLGITVGEAAFHSLILHKENGRPIQLEDRYVNATIVPDYGRQDFSVTTPNQYLSKVFPLSELEHIIEAVLPDSLEQDLLKITADTPCLLVNRRTWSAGNLISCARLVHPGHLYRLTSRSAIDSVIL
ncbi:MAG: histidine utilization repressor [Thermodesulfobacteriota bacterium]|nr:histidine utilization repressor [Thermodesulfobacteriota bacterium]